MSGGSCTPSFGLCLVAVHEHRSKSPMPTLLDYVVLCLLDEVAQFEFDSCALVIVRLIKEIQDQQAVYLLE